MNDQWQTIQLIEDLGFEVEAIDGGRFEIWKDYILQATVKGGSGLFNWLRRYEEVL